MEEEQAIYYQLIQSSRKTISIHIKPDGAVIVRAPYRLSQKEVDRFVTEKQNWIRKNLAQVKTRLDERREGRNRGGARPLPQNQAEVDEYLRQARETIWERTKYYAGVMQVDFGRITIRDQKSRWGSCSSNGNLNFNWRLIMAPAPVLDYVVVHELAHRFEMNHSPLFWQRVAAVMPDYQVHRDWLRQYGAGLREV